MCGPEQLLESCHRCFASLFTDRAIDYRERMGFDHLSVALSVGVQVMVRADRAGAGVIFTLDPETGFPDVIVISAAWGLGETVVSGQVDPDEYTVFKPSLKDSSLNPLIDMRVGAKQRKTVYAGTGLTRTVDTSPGERVRRVLGDDDVRTLAGWARAVEEHYGCPMDLDGVLCGRRSRTRLRRSAPLRGARDRSLDRPEDAYAHHAQSCRSVRRPAAVAPAGRRRRARPAGVHRRPSGEGPPHGAASPGEARRG